MRNKDAKHFIDYLPGEKRIIGWDKDFLDSVKKLLAQGKDLSEGQGEALIKLYERKTGGGQFEKKGL